MEELVSQLVLRNTSIRKDAAYIIALWNSEDWWKVTGHWGPWQRYQDAGRAGLRQQCKYQGVSHIAADETFRSIRTAKLRKGYYIAEEIPAPMSTPFSTPVVSAPQAAESPVDPLPGQAAGLWGALEL